MTISLPVRLHPFISALAFLIILLPNIAFAEESVTVPLKPRNGSGISGTAILTANGDATDATIDLMGLTPGTDGIVNVYANTCNLPSASFALISQFTADANRSVHVNSPVLFHGTNVALSDITHDNIVGVYVSGQMVTCGVIPKLGVAASPPNLPVTGGIFDARIFSILGIIGFIISSAGLLLRRQGRA